MFALPTFFFEIVFYNSILGILFSSYFKVTGTLQPVYHATLSALFNKHKRFANYESQP